MVIEDEKTGNATQPIEAPNLVSSDIALRSSDGGFLVFVVVLVRMFYLW
jgi:hypothetical protein